jgi:hypothetical protein
MIKFTGNSLLSVLLVNISMLVISACAQAQEIPSPSAQANYAIALDDNEALLAQSAHGIKREITVTARVKKILPEDKQGLPHQRFLIELSNGSTILIAHDLKYAPSLPIKPLDVVRIHGEYIWNQLGGLIHWTHHSDTAKHESGWIDFNGLRYQ